MKPLRQQHKVWSRKPPGFTLVVTLSLMILLTVIAVSLLSLTAITLRSSQSSMAQSVARANARMALQMAIGELQKSAGSDRRITATADIRKTVDPSKAHWTGVWNTDTWNPSQPTRNKKFVGWLASDPSMIGVTAAENQVDKALGAGDGKSRKITLVGSGTLGATDAANQVDMLTVPVMTDGVMSGGYAYWVGDEGVKARYDLGERGTPTKFTIANRWAAPPHNGLQKITGLESYEKLTAEEIAKAASYQEMELTQASGLPANLFHHVTTDSVGLPVDVRLGGPKQDLSLAFELPLAEFNALVPFHLDKETNNTAWYDKLNMNGYNKPEFYPSSQQLGYLFMIPADTAGTDRVRGPTWDLLRNHYRLYKNEWEAFSWPRKLAVSSDAVEARGSLPFSYSCSRGGGVISNRFTEFSNESMYFSKSMKGPYQAGSILRQRPSGTFDPALDVIRRAAEKITPLVTRVTFVFGIVRGSFPFSGVKQDTIGVSMDPYITVFNPYNRPIEFYSFGFHASKYNPFSFQLDYTDESGATKTTTYNSSSNYYNQGSLSFRLNPSTAGGKMRLAPGELRVISPDKVVGGIKVDRVGATGLAGTALYNESSGIVIPPDGAPVVPKAGTSITLTVLGRAASGYQEGDFLNFSMFYPKLHGGQSRDVLTDLPPVANVQIDIDSIDDPQVLRMGMSTYPVNGQRLSAKRSLGTSQIPLAGQAGQFVAAFDIWMKDFKGGDVPVLAQFNPRAAALDPRDYDGTSRVSPGWDAQFLSITDISALNLVTAGGQGRWGGGLGSGAGSTSYLCLYDIPSAPLTSIAQLQHADIGSLATDAPYAIGNSFPPPGIPLTSLFGALTLVSTEHTGWGPQSQIDQCWAANEMIWDRYFFSGLNWGSGLNRYPTLTEAVSAMKDSSKDSPFANSRVELGALPANATRLTKFDTIGDHLAVRGAFNINSTSEKAWKAVLAGLDQVELAYQVNGSSKTDQFKSPLTRFSLPQGNDSDRFRGFRALTDEQLDALAKAIVAEVKTRGPFMGLADFVNRRVDRTTQGKAGALQAAIDATTINSALTGTPSAGNVSNKLPSTQAGLPGYVTQADVLSTIGSFISARSDTFKVRAYGEATDKSGNVIARAWCEAVVQRVPDWILPTEVAPVIANSRYSSLGTDLLFRPFIVNTAFPAMDQTFGRRFKMVQFRWLSEADV